MPKTCPVCGVSYADNSVFCPSDGTTLLAEARTGDLIGSVIADRYLVGSLLGEGGMGRVYLARHVRLPQQAAIKVLHPGMVSDPEAVARFNREAANAARIEHDRVARVFDFGETRDGSVYLAMEYVPGHTLRAILEREGRLSAARAANITFQVAEGLDAAHRIHIVHRDLKPDNIMVVTDDDGVDRCKVVDFGIAKATDAGQQTRLTRTGTVVGTPEFMSPEQVLGEAIDARSDVYALALVAYNMLTAVLPFSANTPERAFTARLIDNPRPLRASVPQVDWPADLQLAFDGALDKDPATRTASALEFADAVVAAVEAWTGAAVLRSRTPMSSRGITPVAVPASTTERSAQVDAPRSATAAAPQIMVPPVPATAPAAAPHATRRGRRALMAAGGVTIAVAAWALFLRTPSQPGVRSLGAVAEDSVAVADPAAVSRRGAPNVRSATPTTVQKGAAAQRSESAAALAADQSGPSAPPNAVGDREPVTARVTDAAVTHELDSLGKVLADPDTDEAAARSAIPALLRVMRSLASATDSTWGYVALVSAYGQAGEPLKACNALRSARKLATTAPQRSAITNGFNSEALSCVP